LWFKILAFIPGIKYAWISSIPERGPKVTGLKSKKNQNGIASDQPEAEACRDFLANLSCSVCHKNQVPEWRSLEKMDTCF
jgi:hypothetical protein